MLSENGATDGRREMNEQPLKPCPFCGSETAPTLFRFGQASIVSCSYALGGCDAKGPYKAVSQYAVAAWNKRADQSK